MKSTNEFHKDIKSFFLSSTGTPQAGGTASSTMRDCTNELLAHPGVWCKQCATNVRRGVETPAAQSGAAPQSTMIPYEMVVSVGMPGTESVPGT
jgi:hypothetical protein